MATRSAGRPRWESRAETSSPSGTSRVSPFTTIWTAVFIAIPGPESYHGASISDEIAIHHGGTRPLRAPRGTNLRPHSQAWETLASRSPWYRCEPPRTGYDVFHVLDMPQRQ